MIERCIDKVIDFGRTNLPECIVFHVGLCIGLKGIFKSSVHYHQIVNRIDVTWSTFVF